MKAAIQKLVNLYNTNTRFHSLVIALEYTGLGFLGSWSGGVPSSKSGWIALATGLGGALVGAGKRWLQTNVASQNLSLKQP